MMVMTQKKLFNTTSVVFLLVCFLAFVRSGDDYYEILGVGRDADTRQIRKAFKKLALTHHPDKSDDPEAQEKFLKINKAYETLKDEEKRKRYDRFGEEDEQDKSNFRYQSWNFYHDDFGIYDDDPEIITLSYNDFRRSVSESYDYWFINFYSPQCSHCHQLAPTWRAVARELEGIVRFGAVNCQDDFHLCSEQGIRAYPSLKMFGPSGSVVYRGERDDDALIDFAIRQLPRLLHYMWPANLEKYAEDDNKGQDPKLPWVIMFCDEDDVTCPDRPGRDLVASTLQGLANVGTVDCKRDRKFCETFCGTDDLGVFYFEAGDVEAKAGERIPSLEHREISSKVLELLPDIKDLDDEQYSSILLRLEDDSAKPWLIHFVFGDDGVSVEEKKLRALLPRLKIGRFDCKDNPADCAELMLREPRYVVFKPGGGYEFHYGRSLAPDVAAFARVSTQARTLRTLTHRDFPDILDNEAAVFIDFFAPWCPPCMNLLPEYRKAAILTGGSVVYGTVDCTANPTVCNRFGVRSYPTTVFFNETKPHHYMGQHTGHAIADFVKEILKPSVVQLTHSTFYELVGDKDEDEMWLVDFYAPWCGPCMQLAPQWTNLAKMVEKIPEVKVGKVDCTTEQRLCERELVRSYPSIRMYPLGEEGVRTYIAYTGFRRDAHSLRQWVFDRLPSVVENLTPYSFEHHVLKSAKPALIDFYAPWCGHCQQFAPDFEDIALTLRKRGVLCGKIDCERYRKLCVAAGVRAYPTLRFYEGAEGSKEQEYDGLEIKTQEPSRIIEIVNAELDDDGGPSVHDEL